MRRLLNRLTGTVQHYCRKPVIWKDKETKLEATNTV